MVPVGCKKISSSGIEQQQGLSPSADGIAAETAIKGCQPPPVLDGQSQQIGVGELTGIQQPCGIDSVAVQQTEGIRPELMGWMLDQALQPEAPPGPVGPDCSGGEAGPGCATRRSGSGGR